MISEVNDGVFIEVVGHAGYAEQGKDIVCSAVSALMCAAVAEFDEMNSDGRLIYRARTVTHGYICADVVPKIPGDRDVLSALNTVTDMLKKAFIMLEETYPENVSAEI